MRSLGRLVLLTALTALLTPANPQETDSCTANPASPARLLLVPYSGQHCTHDGIPDVLTSAARALGSNFSYRFSWAEVSQFSRWWDMQDQQVKSNVEAFTLHQHWEFVTGAWVAVDSTLTSFEDATHVLSVGHHFLSEQLRTRPSVAWQVAAPVIAWGVCSEWLQVNRGAGFSSGVPHMLTALQFSGVLLDGVSGDDTSHEPELIWRPHSQAEGKNPIHSLSIHYSPQGCSLIRSGSVRSGSTCLKHASMTRMFMNSLS